MKIFNPIVEHLKLQMRLNLKTRHVELKVICYHLFSDIIVIDNLFVVTIHWVWYIAHVL